MKKDKIFLALFFLIAIVSTIANCIDYTLVVKICRFFLIPIIYSYYYLSSKKVNFPLTLILFLFLIIDYINYYTSNNLKYLLLFGIISYSFFLFYGIQNLVKFKNKPINILSIAIIISFVVFLYINVYDLIILELYQYKVLILIYGLILSALGIVSAYNLNFRNRVYDLYYLFCTVSFIFTDVLFVINSYFYKFSALVVINHFLQIVSYFFIVKYFLVKEQSELRKKPIQ